MLKIGQHFAKFSTHINDTGLLRMEKLYFVFVNNVHTVMELYAYNQPVSNICGCRMAYIVISFFFLLANESMRIANIFGVNVLFARINARAVMATVSCLRWTLSSISYTLAHA